jgi:hypothetical protein
MTHLVPEHFKQQLLAELTGRVPENAGELPALADSRPARGYRPRWRRHPVLAAGMAAAATATAISLLVVNLNPAAAWTVTKQPDGTVAVTIRQLDHPNQLVRELRHDGVRASFQSPPYVTARGTIDRGCFRRASPALRRALTVATSSDPHAAALLLRPSAIPHGVTLQIYWAGYSPVGFRHTKPSAMVGTHTIPLTISGDFAFAAAFVNSAGRCVR